jgi:hypothetical protein
MEATRKLITYLGAQIGELLTSPPFSQWAVTRSVHPDLPRAPTVVHYKFEGHGVEVICTDADRIQTIFLQRGDGEATLSEIPFALSRAEVQSHLGSPSKSGAPVHIPALGDSGAWDRFSLDAGCVHIEYRLDRDEIEMITLMHPDVVP